MRIIICAAFEGYTIFVRWRRNTGQNGDKSKRIYACSIHFFQGGLNKTYIMAAERQRRSNDRERLHMDAYLQLRTVKPYKQRHNQLQRLYHNTYRRDGAELSEKRPQGLTFMRA